MDEEKMPLFLINGFLEAGKTQFIRFTLLLQGEQTCRIGQSLHPLYQGIQECNAAAYERKTEERMALAQQVQFLGFLNQSVFGPAHNGLLLGAAHKNALNQSLTADGSFEITSFLRHGFGPNRKRFRRSMISGISWNVSEDIVLPCSRRHRHCVYPYGLCDA